MVQVHRNGYFLHWSPPPSETLALVTLARVSTSPSCLPSPSPEGPQSMENLLGDFLGEVLALPSKWFGAPQEFRAKICANICAKARAKDPSKNQCKNRCQKDVQTKKVLKFCANRSVQKRQMSTMMGLMISLPDFLGKDRTPHSRSLHADRICERLRLAPHLCHGLTCCGCIDCLPLPSGGVCGASSRTLNPEECINQKSFRNPCPRKP